MRRLRSRIYNADIAWAGRLSHPRTFLRTGSLGDVERVIDDGVEAYGFDITGVHEDAGILRHVPERTRVRVEESEALLAWFEKAPPPKRRMPIVVRCSWESKENLPSRARRLASLGLVPEIVGLGRLDMDCVRSLLAAYLHDRGMAVPIEPFHSMLRAVLARAEVSLWQICRLDPEHYVYVSRSSEVAMCLDDLGTERILGRVSDPEDTWLASPRAREVRAFRDHLFVHRPECASCSSYFLCQGYACFERSECPAWQEAIRAIADAARELRLIFQAMRDPPRCDPGSDPRRSHQPAGCPTVDSTERPP